MREQIREVYIDPSRTALYRGNKRVGLIIRSVKGYRFVRAGEFIKKNAPGHPNPVECYREAVRILEGDLVGAS